MRRSQRTNPASAATSPSRALPAHLHDVRSRPRRPLVRALQLALLGAGLSAAIAHAAPPVIPLSALDGNNGFRLDGVASEDYSGAAVSGVGDINGDGIDDLIIGAYGAGGFSGRSYVVFGRSAGGFTSPINLSALDGGNGFRLDGVAGADYSGSAVSAAGDINGDGIDDLIIGANGADANGIGSGSSYVVFGRSAGGFASAINLSTLNGSNGFRLVGAEGDLSGVAVSVAGDINGDGFDDLVIGARRADPNGAESGSSYVVYGSGSGFDATINLSTLNGSNGFRLDGVAAGDRSGIAVSGVGDINGDGIDDLIVGADFADPFGVSGAGSSYAVFGNTTGFPAVFPLATLNGATGFRIDGVAEGEFSGRVVSGAGDVNGDGTDDLIIGAPFADTNGEQSGSSYVLFGRGAGGFPSLIPLSSLNGSNGFRLDGAVGNRSGVAVSAAGDVNGDGIDDLIIGASLANPNGIGSAGSSYVLFGRSTSFAAVIPLSSLNGSTGFRLDGAAANNRSGSAVAAAGDINGDGVEDLIIGAPFGDPNAGAGRSYVVFGARERIFQDGGEEVNIDVRYPGLAVRNSFIGSAVRWRNGATCNCDFAPFDLNLYNTGGNVAFFWPVGGMNGGVANGTVYSVLQPGAVVGPASEFSTNAGAAATANWRNGADGYLGFRYVNPDSGLVTYGYARIRSTAPTGYPLELIDFGVNLTGEAITIPAQ